MAISMVVLVTLVSCGNEAKKMSKCQGLIICYILILFDSSCQLPRCPCHLRRHCRLPSHPCCLIVALSPSPSPSPRPFACHRIHHVRRRSPTRTVTATVITIGIVGQYPYRCCCHHQRRSSRRRLPCLRRRCPDVTVAADAPAAPPLPPSFVTDPTAGRLRLAMVPRQRRHWRRRRRRRR
jgi:hypothetical protein